MAKVFERLDYRHDVYRAEPAADGYGTISVPDGQEDFSVTVDIDMKALARVAGRAARSKGGKSVCGPLTVTVISREKVQG